MCHLHIAGRFSGARHRAARHRGHPAIAARECLPSWRYWRRQRRDRSGGERSARSLYSGSQPQMPMNGRGTWFLFTAAEGVHINGERLDGNRIKLAAPGRHHAAMTIPDTVDDRLGTGPVEPNLVGQIRSTKRTIAFAIRSMTDRAIVAEDFRASRKIGAGGR